MLLQQQHRFLIFLVRIHRAAAIKLLLPVEHTKHPFKFRKEFKIAHANITAEAHGTEEHRFLTENPSWTYLQHHVVDVCGATRSGHHRSAFDRARIGTEHEGMSSTQSSIPRHTLAPMV